jgi:hypothetical protein
MQQTARDATTGGLPCNEIDGKSGASGLSFVASASRYETLSWLRATVVSFPAIFLRAAVFFARNVTVCRTVSMLARVKPRAVAQPQSGVESE